MQRGKKLSLLQASISRIFLNTHCVDLAVKLQLLYCSLSIYVLLFTASYYLRSPILWSDFLSLWLVIFKATNANPQHDSFQSQQHLKERNITCSQM